jgi:hypothetical protein
VAVVKIEFYVGLHQPSDAKHFDKCMISVNRLKRRKSQFTVKDWIIDSGAFSQIYLHGQYDEPVSVYAEQIKKWSKCGNLVAAVAQDMMCEPFILHRTGLTVKEHQKLTLSRYVELVGMVSETYIMPVLQGYEPEDYVEHIKMYGNLLYPGMWVGVGSVCKRNNNPLGVIEVLYNIKKTRPDLKLHGFGLKITALKNGTIRNMLYSADSMAWSYHARKNGRNANDFREAVRFADKVNSSINTIYQASIYDYLW